jgi:hypothetical protein
MEEDMIIEDLIQMHSSWIAINSIQGCPNKCQYCFMRRYESIGVKPVEIATPEETIEALLKFKYYQSNIPLCLFPSTDIMATKSNISYLLDLFNEIEKRNLLNPLVLVTKMFIPDEVIDKISFLKSTGRKIIVYLSYSELPKSVEPTINKEKLKLNFVRLHERQIPIIHYFRPIIPQNATSEIIEKVIDYVSQYSLASVTTGLKVNKQSISDIVFWPEIEKIPDADSYECIWPKGALEKIRSMALKNHYPIFQSNSCALALALGEWDRYGFWDTDVCKNFNNCPAFFREKCEQKYNEKQFSLEHIKNKFEKIMLDLGFIREEYSYEIDKQCNSINLYVNKIDTQTLCYLSRCMSCRIQVKCKIENTVYWNNGTSNAPQLIL